MGEQNCGAKMGSKYVEQKGEQNSGAKLGARIGAKPQTRTYPNEGVNLEEKLGVKEGVIHKLELIPIVKNLF